MGNFFVEERKGRGKERKKCHNKEERRKGERKFDNFESYL